MAQAVIAYVLSPGYEGDLSSVLRHLRLNASDVLAATFAVTADWLDAPELADAVTMLTRQESKRVVGAGSGVLHRALYLRVRVRWPIWRDSWRGCNCPHRSLQGKSCSLVRGSLTSPWMNWPRGRVSFPLSDSIFRLSGPERAGRFADRKARGTAPHDRRQRQGRRANRPSPCRPRR